ncbi:I78 family peptidase inhibitor [Luteimonas vadosa]|uniref:Peptidase inhibitor I78 family protein n=1 Tax=Luteimonas vadosa TaxID=1165507 RepID=A0ABP9DRZ8_9GAMM
MLDRSPRHHRASPWFGAMLLFALGACAPIAPPTEDPPMTSCNADAARVVIGRTASEDVVEQARRAAGARVARTLKPGQVVTMEYHPSRLNIDVDDDNVVVNVRCG